MKPVKLTVRSEVGVLKKVLLHRPGAEMETLTPTVLDDLLFDDIPWLKRLQEEHDGFAETLRRNDCEVYYYADLLEEILVDGNLAAAAAKHLVDGGKIPAPGLRTEITERLSAMAPKELANVLICGLRKDAVPHRNEEKRLSWWIQEDFPYYIDPLPNLYFTRDPGVIIGDGVAVGSMGTRARKRESWLLDLIRSHHPLFDGIRPEPWYTPEMGDDLEGGDVLVLSENAVAVGAGVRTGSDAIETLARRLFNRESGIRHVLAVRIPAARAYMHLDTVFTMVDRNTFTLFPGVADAIRVFHLTPLGRGVRIRESENLHRALETVLNLSDIRIIPSGGSDRETAAREQWNDSTNTLAIQPGTVITYNRNTASNSALEDSGIEVLEIEGSELVRGRGGPRCMSMPLLRETL